METAAEHDDPVAEAPLLGLSVTEVVERYEKLVYGVAVSHTGCRADADDVYQDVFLAYHRRQPELRSEDHRQAWLITTTLNCARSVSRSSWRTRVVPLNSEVAEPVEPFRFATPEQNDIFEALRSLPEKLRTPLYLFYFADLTTARIAELLELAPTAVRMRLSRGRSAMRDRLQKGHFDD